MKIRVFLPTITLLVHMKKLVGKYCIFNTSLTLSVHYIDTSHQNLSFYQYNTFCTTNIYFPFKK